MSGSLYFRQAAVSFWFYATMCYIHQQWPFVTRFHFEKSKSIKVEIDLKYNCFTLFWDCFNVVRCIGVGGGGVGTANPSLSQRNSLNFCSHQIIFTFVQILIPIAAPAFANKAPHCEQPTTDKSAARLWKFDTLNTTLRRFAAQESLLHPWWGTQWFFFPLFFPLWAAGNVHSAFGRSRTQLNAVSL